MSAQTTTGCPSEITQRDKQVLKHLFNPGLPYGDDVAEEVETDDESNSTCEQLKQAKELEVNAVKAAESGDIAKAINLFDQATQVAPLWASTYNNRAQALRLKGDVEGAKADLEKALELSHGKGTTACQAYTQRGLLRKKDGDEDGARDDFNRAAMLGGAFAKQLLASMNPYAALCNQMLGEVIGKIRAGEGEI